jgi:hypothetical protein
MSTDPPRVDEIEQPEPDPKTLAERLFTDAPTPGGAAEHMDPNFDLAMKPLQPYPPGVPVDPRHPPQMPAGRIDTPKVWPGEDPGESA